MFTFPASSFSNITRLTITHTHQVSSNKYTTCLSHDSPECRFEVCVNSPSCQPVSFIPQLCEPTNISGMADKTPLSKDGSVGEKFRPDGEIGQVGEKIGGPFSSDGKVGKEFTSKGAVGGKAQEMAESDSVFDKDGAVGKEFQADGKIGQVGEKIGGPFSKDGTVGKQFTDKGAIGGTVQENLGSKKQ